ncbi:dihydrodipicolinate synthase/N-acetylneuraminate lyase [Anaerobacterium chartisolvens]|uniref:Dihydrodipicolinate synthase/N-acetylneuraminate lyase n=1 Tax=Anaerobacterium chartisolvens TaxID=1297424 RepID=A0A369AIZ3_9FIRM|nr:dihydrodipicolinate synthase family protein [Anaerobacterium chartisolvens]RCX09342.1 dihydrodipicolinate synthase/N-acetylneuraminate lyase [Anaerobacterium chartisolvens]
MKAGFYPALGTPVDEMGNFISESFKRQIEDQISQGAAGLLVMGSMGIEPYIRQSEYSKIAASAVEAAAGRCPVLVGVMDNSISRVNDRIALLKGLKIDGVVATTPFYYLSGQEELKGFFEKIALSSPYPLYLYDLPAVTKTKISADTARYLMKLDNIKGIKTGDLVLARELMRCQEKREDFSVIFSGLDVFDAAYSYGIKMNLDGMFSCTPAAAGKMYRCLEKGDMEQAAKHLDSILALRNCMAEVGIFSGFTYAMNILGYEGIFSPDYMYRYDESNFDKVRKCMSKL